MINQIVIEVLSDNSQHKIQTDQQATQGDAPEKNKSKATRSSKPRAPRITKLEQVMCPVCKQGHIVKGRTAYGCSRFREGCKMLLPFSEYSAELTPSKLNKEIQKNYGK